MIPEFAGTTALADAALEPSGGETLADTGLQLRVAAGRIQELGSHAAGIVLGAACDGTRIGLCRAASKGEDHDSQDDRSK